MEKGKSVGVIEKIRRDDPIEYFLPTGKTSLLIPRGNDSNKSLLE